MSNLADSLPIQRAIRLVLGSISYSNPLPPWFEPPKVSYSIREKAIRQKVRAYLDKEKPKPAFEIQVPKKGGEKRAWSIPTVNDQIVTQACVSALAEAIYGAVDRARVFSYRYNADKKQLLLTAEPGDSWKNFQKETERRAKGGVILQFDLENAFGSIDRQKFINFLESRAPKRTEVSLLDKMLGSFSKDNNGLPLVNDSVFFMGNAYLQVVDQVVAKHSTNFIRFIDDYRLFGSSKPELEASLMEIGKELGNLGFKVKDSKTKLGSAEEYLEAITQSSTSTAGMDEYTSAVLEEVPSAAVLKNLVTRAVATPDDLLNEGMGRLNIGAIRVMRSTARMKGESPLKQYQTLVSQDHDFIRSALDLLENCHKSKDEVWRSIWLLYVLGDVSPVEDGLKQRRKALLDSASKSAGVDDLVRLWARKVSAGEMEQTRGQDPEKLDELEYPECGRRLWNT